ncbi:hypothetical protein BAE44_0012404 [Dichanthelium oligosanthes]|uniref:C2H2-type domain-containing protein n=1 Tax=Dichanthelium oligosanthes TaxID=888268 RepID=A0A1E5VNC0_9POAL|nr:hypothetical protein BAE44_0012404 [Dichanthelium oligosanthes]
MEQMAKYYWGMLSARTSGAGAPTSLRSWPPPAHGSGGEPSWEELAFARDAAGHLGGCVWPPRSYTCTFCRREFRSAQALGGHMNVHRRDRARLRQCASPDHDVVQDDAQKQQSIAAPPADHHHHLLQLQESPLFRAKAVLISSGPNKSTCDQHQITYNKEEAVISTTTTTSPAYISTIIKESKDKVVMSIPAATAGSKEAIAIDEEKEEEIVAERRKRRRVHQQPAALPPPLFFLRPLASSRGVEHDAKVPKVITSPSPNSLQLSGRQEVDLELRLGTSPKVA